jgi:hypothetical protein
MLREIKKFIPSQWKRSLRRHKFAAARSLARRAAAQEITRIDDRYMSPPHKEIRAFMVVRNESLRLPFTLKYYFDTGVDRIFVLDHDSSDDTQSVVLSFDNTHLFHTNGIYAHQAAWIDVLLRRYGNGSWCLVIDADELFIYPDYETVSLKGLCEFLDREATDALDCVLLDMYPEKPLSEVHYQRGTNPLYFAPCFDRPSYSEGCAPPCYVNDLNIVHEGPPRFFGGVRKRVFGINPILSKVPLIKFHNSIYLSPGTHFIQRARVAADLRGALLHFKFLGDFPEHVEREVARAQRAHGNEVEYSRYLATLDCQPDIDFRSDVSLAFAGSRQLIDVGVMKKSEVYDLYIKGYTRSKPYTLRGDLPHAM